MLRDVAGRMLRKGFIYRPSIDALEVRCLLSANPPLPDFAMVSATTKDSESITIDYKVENAPITQAIPIQVERSADTQSHTIDPIAGTVVIAASGQFDDAGKPATAVGEHTLTLNIPGGLPPTPALPYVVVTADPGHTIAQSSTSDDTASFHKYTVAVISHGGFQPDNWKTNGPPWERHLAARLRGQGFDQVIAYNWVTKSSIAGEAAKQGPVLAKIVTKVVDGFDTTDPVDVQFIGHSEGTVVNSQAMLALNRTGWPQATDAGYLKVTMLDPHAANNGVKGQQYSVSNGFLGWIAREIINNYQSRAHDPAVVVPPNVDSAEVFYQHTPIKEAYGSNDGIYNLWGQVPIHGQASYYNLTAPGISHSGKFSVQDWYSLNVAPTLGVGAPTISTQALTVEQVGPGVTALSRAPIHAAAGPKLMSFQGTVAPDTEVKLYAGRVGPNAPAGDLRKVGDARSDAAGNWHITTRAIAAGTYRFVAQADAVVSNIGRTSPLKPIGWVGPVRV